MKRDVVVPCKVQTLVSSTLLEQKNSRKTYTPEECQDVWSNIDFFVQYWKLTPSQGMAFHTLRDVIADIDHFLNRPNVMIRFLKVQHFSVPKSESMIRRMFAWRLQHKVDTILEEYTPPPELLEKYPGSIIQGLDYKGDPMLYGRFGVTDYDGMLQHYGYEELWKYEVYRREAMIQGEWIQEYETLREKRPIQQLTFVEDIGGMTLGAFTFRVSSSFMKIMKMQQDYYPEIEKLVLIINTPPVFKFGWSIVKPFFRDAMASKFRFATPSETLDLLEEYAPLEIFPPNLYSQGHGQVATGMSPHFDGGKITGHCTTAETKSSGEHDDNTPAAGTVTTRSQRLGTASSTNTASDHTTLVVEPVILNPDTGVAADVWDNMDYFCHYWHLSTEEQEALDHVRIALQDVKHELNRPSILVRFFKSQSGNTEKTITMIRNMFQWRIDNDVDELLDTYTPPPLLLDKYPGAILEGMDRDGDPIFLSRIGVTDIPGFIDKYGLDEMMKFEIYKREFATSNSGSWLYNWERAAQRPIRQIIIIEDLKGLTSKMINSKVAALYQKVMKMDQDNYAEASKKILIIRAPRLFTFAWNYLIKHFFEAHVVAKMEFATEDNYLPLLEKYMDLSVLPPCIVGSQGSGRAVEGMPPNFEGGTIAS